MKTNTWNAAIPLALAWLAIALDMAHAGAFSVLV
jgi:hypothetical protein